MKKRSKLKKTLLILAGLALVTGCTTGHRGAELDWTPGDAPTFYGSECPDGCHDLEAEE